VAAAFRVEGWEVTSLVRSPKGLANEIVLDLDACDTCGRLTALPDFEAVVHLASHVDLSPNAGIDAFYGTNIYTTSHLARYAKSVGAHLLLASSIAVYGQRAIMDSSTPINPVLPYARAKYVAEQILQASGASYSILRIAGVFGYLGPGHLALNTAITKAVDRRLPPTLHGSGSARRNYIYVEDLATCVVDCVKERHAGVHLAAGPEPISIASMLAIVSETLVPGAPVLHQQGPEGQDVLVSPSTVLPAGRDFRAAIEHINSRAGL
jgi:nucleoside-diphosphate-sugar epimerase